MDEEQQRAAVIAEAKTWLHTPWRHQGQVKGQAADCAMFLLESFVRAGVIERFDPGRYPRLWFLHHTRERFLEWIAAKGGVEIPVERARPGDLIVYKIGLCYSHGALVIDPEHVMHAYHKNARVIVTEIFDGSLIALEKKAFDMFASKRQQHNSNTTQQQHNTTATNITGDSQ